MSLFLGSNRVAGHNSSITPDDISNKAVFFSDSSQDGGGGEENFDTINYEDIDSQITSGSMLNHLVSMFKKMGKYLDEKIEIFKNKVFSHLIILDDGATAIESKNGQTLRRLQMQSANDDVVYYKSVDGGQTWNSKILPTNDRFSWNGVWTLEQVNDYTDWNFKIGAIDPTTAQSIGLPNTIEYFQVIYIPWTGDYPSQIFLTAAGREKMYFRMCHNGVWSVPKEVITSSILGNEGTVTSIGANGYNNDFNQHFHTYFSGGQIRTLGTYRDVANNYRSIYSDQYNPNDGSWSNVIELVLDGLSKMTFQYYTPNDELILKWRISDTDHRWISITNGGINFFKWSGTNSTLIWSITP